MLTGPDLHRVGAHGEALAALEVDVAAVAHERDPLPGDRHIDVVEALTPPRHEAHLEGVLAVRREGVEDADAAPRPERRPLHALPLVLRDGGRVRVRDGSGRRIAVPDGAARDLAGRSQIRVHQCGRQRLRDRDVVEAVGDGVGRQPLLGIHRQPQQVVHDVRVLGAIETLKGPRAHMGTGGGGSVDDVLELLRECGQGVSGGAARAGRRHHPRTQLADHALGGLGALVGPGDVEADQREVAPEAALVVAPGAVALNDFREGGGVGIGGCGGHVGEGGGERAGGGCGGRGWGARPGDEGGTAERQDNECVFEGHVGKLGGGGALVHGVGVREANQIRVASRRPGVLLCYDQ